MSEKIDMEKRKTVFRRLPLIAGAALFNSFSLIPESAEAWDLKYKEYSPPDYHSLEKLLLSMNYPKEFEFCYEIPENGDKNGDSLHGNFKISRDIYKTMLTAEIRHPRESKILTLSEERDFSSGMVFYTERDFDLNKGIFIYDRTRNIWQGDRSDTPIGLIEDLINEKIQHTSFYFQGNGPKINEHNLEIKTKKEKEFDLVHEAKIKGDSPRVTKIKAFYKIINQINIPVEIHVDYKVKAIDLPIIGSVYVTPTIIGILSV